MFTSRSPDLYHVEQRLTPQNSLYQVTLCSKGKDCTFEEFQAFSTTWRATEKSTTSNVKGACPTEFSSFPTVSTRIVTFSTVQALCSALAISPTNLALFYYRERRYRGDIVTAQILGTTALCCGTNVRPRRRIFIGASASTLKVDQIYNTLSQNAATWVESSWESQLEHDPLYRLKSNHQEWDFVQSCSRKFRSMPVTQ
eukprot:IDg19203t1